MPRFHEDPAGRQTSVRDYAVSRRRAGSGVVEDDILGLGSDDFVHEIIADDFDSNTKAHYLPNEPRRPAAPTPPPPPLPPPPAPPCRSRGCLAPPNSMGFCTVHFTTAEIDIERVTVGSRSIAEAFQDMLRQAFMAGTAATTSGETFETWYQREVLR